MGQMHLTFGILMTAFYVVHAYYRTADLCPRGFERYHGYQSYDTTCPNHCNRSRDCTKGEICCIEKREYDYGASWMSEPGEERCSVCKKADFGCYDEETGQYRENGEIYSEDWHENCLVCQCLKRNINCLYICETSVWKNNWVSAGIVAGVALFISVVFTLSLCCCLTCSCKVKRRKAVPRPPPAIEAQPANDYYTAPLKEEQAPLTNCEVA